MAMMLTGSEILIRCLQEEKIEHVFGYPGGSVLHIYDELFKQDKIKHILVRHEQAAVHAADAYSRSTQRIGVALVTSGPGVTNAVTGIATAHMDSIPLVVICGQVPTHAIGQDAFQECDTVGITRPCTKHNWLVRDVNDLARILHEAFHIARTGRPGPVVIDLPKDVQFGTGNYVGPSNIQHKTYKPKLKPEPNGVRDAVDLIASAKKPIFYTGGGVINSGPKASQLLREFVRLTGFPITQTLMGLGAYPTTDRQFLGMLGMHGTYEANMAMHDCDVMINIGARFDDRITGRVDAFSPGSRKIHVDIDPSSINKIIHVDIPILGDVAYTLEELLRVWKTKSPQLDKAAHKAWWKQIEGWRARKSLSYKAPNKDVIMPQFALERLQEHTKGRDVYVTTDVGQHQMWAAQYLQFDEPNRWMTSGGLGTMGYGVPAAVGVQIAHPKSLTVCVSGDASFLMNMQEMTTAVQYRLPIKVMILNNKYMGMVRQWQQLLHGNRMSESYNESMPDFVKLADAFGATGIRCDKAGQLDEAIDRMIKTPGPVIFDCVVATLANCFPMIPSGKAHNEMILGEATDAEVENAIGTEGKMLV